VPGCECHDDDSHRNNAWQRPRQREQPKLVAYNDFLWTLATEKYYLLAVLNADMQAAIANPGPKEKRNQLTGDGVRINPAANEMMTTCVLREFGLSAEQITKAQSIWASTRIVTIVKTRQNRRSDTISRTAPMAKSEQTAFRSHCPPRADQNVKESNRLAFEVTMVP
jgi:hypothetical protein